MFLLSAVVLMACGGFATLEVDRMLFILNLMATKTNSLLLTMLFGVDAKL